MEGRLAQLKRTLRKFGTEQEALAQLEVLKRELEGLDNWEELTERARVAEAAALKALGKGAARLSRAREAAVETFCRPLQALLREFAMPHAEIRVALNAPTAGLTLPGGGRCTAAGAESVELLFSANPGEEPQPLGRVASGGELSRLMLALRTLTASPENTPLLVFDEVDTGISGAAARCVAERLAALGQRCQVLCVTHNPSVASAAQHHVLVEKRVDQGRTTSHATVVEGKRRQEELARLLDGGQLSRQGMALAGEMLRQAG